VNALIEPIVEFPSIGDRLTALVAEILGQSAVSGHLPADVPLRDLGMSSVKMVNLMLRVEAAFDITIPEDQITPENFTSIGVIEALVTRLAPAPIR